MINQVDFAGGLRAVLRDKGMTIKRLAELMQVDPKNISNQLLRNNVLLSTVSRMAFAIGVTPSELVKAAEIAAKEKQVAKTQVAAHTDPTPHNTGK